MKYLRERIDVIFLNYTQRIGQMNERETGKKCSLMAFNAGCHGNCCGDDTFISMVNKFFEFFF